MLVYATHTGTRDISGRMEDFLGRHGFRVAVMKADAAPPERRESWVAKRVGVGVDVLVCHPRLVQTGLDLVEFPTIVWYETELPVFQSTPTAALLVDRELAVASLRKPRPGYLPRLGANGLRQGDLNGCEVAPVPAAAAGSGHRERSIVACVI